MGNFNLYTTILQVIFALILLLAVFFFLIRLVARKNRSFFHGRSVKALGGVPLGPNRSIQIVEIGRVLYIVGVAENIQLLDKIEDEEEIEWIRENMAAGLNVSFQGFQPLGQWFRNKFGAGKGTEEEIDQPSFQQVFHHKLQRISDRKKQVEELLQEKSNQDR